VLDKELDHHGTEAIEMDAHSSHVQELLGEPEIAQFLISHQGAAKEINSAVGLLAEEPDSVAAVKKLLPALAEKVVYVFFSYKKKDERAAKAVVNILRKYSAGKLRITYQAEFTEEIVGKQWREKIRKEVCRANWFILLLPDPSDDWDWCLYETGLFDRQPTSADRLICFHHPDTQIPSPIEDYHAVPATIPEVEKFLRMVYVKDDPVPGMRRINRAIEPEIPKIAKDIVDAIRPPRKGLVRRRLEPWLKLKVENATKLQDRGDLDDALIVSANRKALDLFEFIEQPKTWGELRSSLIESAEDGRWRDELFHVIRKIAQGRKFSPIQAVFHTKDGKIYRPVAYAIDRIGEGGAIETYHLTFTEEVGVVDNTAIPNDVSTLATMLRLAFRFRWEVLEKFSDGNLTEEDIERISNAITRMEIDAESRGVLDQGAVMSLFQPQEAKRIEEMFALWYKLRNRAERTGELDVALEKKDSLEISAHLAEMLPLNQEFLEIAAERFSALVSGK